MSNFTDELEYIPTFDERGRSTDENGILEDDERRVFSCPSCAGVNITLQGRCVVCTDCGWSSCEL
jgi:predicted RNA-binding Zn-ribbon protein involved in translation (DUF1610 family)